MQTSIRTPYYRNRVLSAFNLGLSIPKAARQAEISPTTLYSWLEDDEEFLIECMSRRVHHETMSRARLIDLLDDQDPKVRIKAIELINKYWADDELPITESSLYDLIQKQFNIEPEAQNAQ